MKKTILFTAVSLGLLSAISNPGWASSDAMTNMQGKMDHAAMGMKMNMDKNSEKPAILPKEGGQAAFATIAEIVALLKNDPKTDWSRVNINALREHLVDMNELTLNTSVKTTLAAKSIAFNISGKGRAIRAIQNMVPAHSSVLRNGDLYNAAAELTDNGAIMRVEFANKQQLSEIKALGFYGLMATGSSHQVHHMQMALGNM